MSTTLFRAPFGAQGCWQYFGLRLCRRSAIWSFYQLAFFDPIRAARAYRAAASRFHGLVRALSTIRAPGVCVVCRAFGGPCGRRRPWNHCQCVQASARLAQSVERKALNLVVVGSSPTVGASVVTCRNWGTGMAGARILSTARAPIVGLVGSAPSPLPLRPRHI